ncbi:RNA methyltransferase [Candidatus Peregrinibacteria bacterium CG10_big_fil_rev_8_21_14_0_10_55_24]|nr:MAG: RNA methyltransferase [Candidatus Peregrinibacteria bacterium CG10_big_fil_rev_8_21_14_0_10_55_24]
MERHIVLLAYNIRSLWNVGSLFRTSDAFGVEKLLLSGYTALPPRREISKTALGAEKTVPWEHMTDPIEAMNRLRKEGYGIVALEQTQRSVALEEFHPPERLCLIVGHEVTGVDRKILALCDACVEIRMLGAKESLNVAVAAGIALYHLRTA